MAGIDIYAQKVQTAKFCREFRKNRIGGRIIPHTGCDADFHRPPAPDNRVLPLTKGELEGVTSPDGRTHPPLIREEVKESEDEKTEPASADD
jgi:hypothetical protein